MTDEQYEQAVNEMKRFATGYVRKSHRASMFDYIDAGSGDEMVVHRKAMCHIGWMLEHMPPNGEKGMRWLGFIQGVLWSMGEATIDEMRQVNMKKVGAA